MGNQKRKRFVILIEDDFEIFGNGLGNVADQQYLPALFLMNTAEEFGTKITFMVDVAHQLALSRYQQKNPNLRIQKNLWDETVRMMKERGFDVQLHIHSQWIDPVYEDGHFKLNRNWNIGCCKPSEQKQILSDSIKYLKCILQPIDPDYQVIAFKAGSWGLQPSSPLLQELRNAGIRIVMGVRDSLRVHNASIDYTGLEEKYLPYQPLITDVTKVSLERNGLVVIPLQPYAPDLLTLLRLSYHVVVNRIRYKTRLPYYYEQSIPEQTRRISPFTWSNDFRFSIRPYLTHLKIGKQPFFYLKTSFDAVLRRLRDYDIERIPIVIESHTKQYHNAYGEIKRFIGYIAERYEDEVEFKDITSYLKEIDEDPDLVTLRK
jgi:hypothetical protein